MIFLYSILSFLFDLFLVTSSWAIQNRYLVWNVFAIVEYCLLSCFFYLIIESRTIRILILLFSVLYIAIFCFFVKRSDDNFNSILSAIGSVIMLFLSLAYFVIALKPSAGPPQNILTPVFLIVVALLLYVASTLFLYIIANRLTTREMEQYWSINHVSNILINLIFAAAFLLYRYQSKNPSPGKTSVDFTRSPE